MLAEPPARSPVEALLADALRLRRLSELSGFLKSIARHFDAQGVILWRQEDFGDSLHLLYQYPAALDRPQTLPMRDSLTGYAVARLDQWRRGEIAECAENVPSFGADPRTNKQFHFLKEIRAMVVVPFRYEDGVDGALNLYRTEPQPFSDEDFENARAVGRLMPGVYQSVLERLSFAIVDDVNRILGGERNAEDEVPEEPEAGMRAEDIVNDNYAWPEEDVAIVRQLCRSLAKHLECWEVAVFLNHPAAPRDVYLEVANTWESPRNRQYRASVNEGLTGWVLANEGEVLIDDLRTFSEEQRRYQQVYPRIVWRDGNRIMEKIRDLLKVKPEDPLQPLSYMGVPIIGKRLYGAIRCSVAFSHPYYFSRREVALVRIVAAQLARFWSGWLEQRTWLDVVENVSDLNRDIEKQLSNASNYNLKRIHVETLRRIFAVIPEASILDIRMYNAATKSLEFVAWRGAAWQKGGEAEREKRRKKTFPVNGRSAGAEVFRTGEPWYVDVGKEGSEHYDPTFPEARQLYTIPIRSAHETVGVIDARSTSELFARHTKAALLLFGRQLGLYHDLVATLTNLKDAEKKQRAMAKEREQSRRRQGQVYRDLAHQFRSPIWVAHRRAAALVRQMGGDDKAPASLVSVRTLCARAESVVYSTRMFVDLAEEKEITKALSWFTVQELIEKLEQAAADHQLIPEPDFGITFRVFAPSFRTAIRSLRMDGALFDHALSNVLDNAGKYSYAHTQVRIEPKFTSKGRFYIAVSNVGIAIKDWEIQKVLEREYQSELAKSVSGVGSGIGLWLADHIMKVHGGGVEARPTNAAGLTEIRLIFGESYVDKWSDR
jgi:signal transduction histidine kinase